MEQFFGSASALAEFEKMENIQEKIKLMWGLPVSQDLLKSAGSGRCGGKSEGESRRWRDAGNKHFQAGRDMDAVRRFNQAVAAAPQQEGRGRDLSLAFANRSAALLKLGHPHLALEDIAEAVKAGYPQDLTYKVFERRLRCLIFVESTKVEVEEAHMAFEASLAFAKLDDPKKDKLRLEMSELVDGKSKPGQISTQIHLPIPAEEVPILPDAKSNLPALSSAVTIRYEPGRGRFAVANREILAGSLVLVEKPFVSCLDVEKEEDHCHHCLVNCPLRQLPCQGCVRARYCSSKCRQAAGIYHHFECGVKDPMVALLGKLRQDGQDAAARRRDFHRTCFRAVAQIPFEQLVAHREKLESLNERVGVDDGVVMEDGGELMEVNKKSDVKAPSESALASSCLTLAFSLVGHREKSMSRDQTSLLLSAIFQLRSLQILGYFPGKRTKLNPTISADEAWLGEVLYSFFEKMQWNTHSVIEGLPDPVEEKQEPVFENRIQSIGKGLYPSFALLNHSCESNMSKYFIGDLMVAQASKTIKKGEEVTENYHPIAMVMERDERQKYLESSYNFVCACKACDNNLPTIRQLPLEDNLTIEAKEVWAEMLAEAKLLQVWRPEAELEKRFSKVCEIQNRLQQLAPNPSRALYKAEQYFWKAQRLAHGNKMYMHHEGENGQRYHLQMRKQ